ncbi:ArsR/SmtB family transcription factor [Amycolatopsis solani]|uniref:ArsR/SmtB family transcription factor n=1 Tax=Amycolatopsis solani TaxID=3028615 RepID=UPI0025B17E56|nr:metalloregulator ArsR/SmtB family transcription factor [Amycolatopsis sp. MEP2-6]
MDEVFKALADPSRRLLLDVLNERNGQTLRELCAGLEMARQSVSKHLAVLETAGLVTTTWRGREKLHHLDAAPINAIADRWMTRYDRRRAGALADLKRALESAPMNEFAYTTYINTTPEKLWKALTDPAFTRQYWGVSFETDWKKGSPMAWAESGAKTEDPAQVVLESDPYRRLSYTWHTFTAEWADANGINAGTLAKLQGESRTKVTFTLEPQGELVKLTVLHDGFDDDSTTRAMCSQGWPALLSSLKTLLETGVPLP